MAGVSELIELFLDGLDDPRVTLNGIHNGDAGRKIDETAPFNISNLGALGLCGIDIRAHAHGSGNRHCAARLNCVVHDRDSHIVIVLDDQ